MDLYVLNSDFKPETLIDGYETFIWTERYAPAGEFTLTTAKISETMQKMPLDSYVAINDSDEVARIENHIITQNEDGVELLDVSGRTFETVYETRTTLSSPNSNGLSPITDSSGYNTAVVAYNTTSDMAAYLTLTQHRTIYGIDSRDLLDNHSVNSVVSGSPTLPTYTRFLNRGNAYEVALDILKEDNLGLRNKRPAASSSFGVNTQIYRGSNKTTTVIFDAKAGHFKNARYLLSVKNYRNVVYVASQKNFRQVIASGASGYSGLDRKVATIDFPEISQTGSDVNAILDAKGRSFLSKSKKLTMVEGSVSSNTPYVYGVDYRLGDIVLCKGKYGVSSNMMVDEFVRIQDRSGETQYPSLSVI